METKIQQLERLLAKPVSDYPDYIAANKALIAAETIYKDTVDAIHKYRDVIALELLKEKEKQHE